MKVWLLRRMAQGPVGEYAVSRFDHRGQADPQNHSRLAQGQAGYLNCCREPQPIGCPLNGNISSKQLMIEGCALTIRGESIGGPLARRGKIDLVVGGAILQTDKRFKTAVLPQTIDMPWRGGDRNQ